MKNLLTFLLAAFMTLSLGAAPKQYNLTSPDGRLEMKIHVGEGLSYDVLHDGVLLLDELQQPHAFVGLRHEGARCGQSRYQIVFCFHKVFECDVTWFPIL